MRLTMDLHRPDPTTVVLRPAGVLDAATAPRLERWLAESLAYHARVLIDLSRLSSCSGEALDILGDARRRAARHHVVLEVLPGSHPAPDPDWAPVPEPRSWSLTPAVADGPARGVAEQR